MGVRLKAFVVWLLARLVLATVRIRVLHSERLKRAHEMGKPLLYAFWHGRQMGLFKAHAEPRAAVMASLSADGEMQARICRRFGLEVVRGSSSRAGLVGLLALSRCLRHQTAVGMAVDGPRGPAFEAKPGIVLLARASGSPIVPITLAYRRRWELGRAWDRFQIPKPFTTAALAYGEPILVAGDALQPELQRTTERLTERLQALTAEVDRWALAG